MRERSWFCFRLKRGDLRSVDESLSFNKAALSSSCLNLSCCVCVLCDATMVLFLTRCTDAEVTREHLLNFARNLITNAPHKDSISITSSITLDTAVVVLAGHYHQSPQAQDLHPLLEKSLDSKNYCYSKDYSLLPLYQMKSDYIPY